MFKLDALVDSGIPAATANYMLGSESLNQGIID